MPDRGDDGELPDPHKAANGLVRWFREGPQAEVTFVIGTFSGLMANIIWAAPGFILWINGMSPDTLSLVELGLGIIVFILFAAKYYRRAIADAKANPRDLSEEVPWGNGILF